MPKTRFTATDVRAMVRDLRATVLGLRVVNIYDLDAKTYLMKLANPGQEKALLLLESGVRFHTTKFTHDKADMPSGFSMKLRKHIRSKRLEDVRQIGMDRVVDFKFGSGETCNHVILELYASGNIILTDHKYEILNLLRTHTYEGTGEGDVSVAVRQIYPVDLATSQEGVMEAASTVLTPVAPAVGGATLGAEEAGSRGKVAGGAQGVSQDTIGEHMPEMGYAYARGLPMEEAAERVSRWL
ncbi:unnamed protein product, partial [Discosporangium mesarthrocarpum]